MCVLPHAARFTARGVTNRAFLMRILHAWCAARAPAWACALVVRAAVS